MHGKKRQEQEVVVVEAVVGTEEEVGAGDRTALLLEILRRVPVVAALATHKEMKVYTEEKINYLRGFR
jgi:hypothetical protein